MEGWLDDPDVILSIIHSLKDLGMPSALHSDLAFILKESLGAPLPLLPDPQLVWILPGLIQPCILLLHVPGPFALALVAELALRTPFHPSEWQGPLVANNLGTSLKPLRITINQSTRESEFVTAQAI